MPAPAQVTLPSDTEIRVSREFDAPRSLVYLAFTKPELVRRWLLGPPGWTMPVCEMDLRVGGRYRYRWRSDDGTAEFGFQGEYVRIDPEEVIDTDERSDEPNPPGKMRVTTTFTALGGRTRVDYLMVAESKQMRDTAIGTGMTDGMEMSFKLLDRLVADLAVP